MQRTTTTLIFLSLLPFLGWAQDPAFFSTLKNERMTSSNKITWSQFGPGNAGYVNFLRYHPTNPDICLTSPDMHNTYQTEDNGKTWYTVKDPDGTGLYVRRLADMYYSEKEPKFGLAIEGSRCFTTNDTGKSWQYQNNCPWYDNDNQGFDKKGWYAKVSAIGLDPQDEKVWLVGAGAHPRGQSHLGWNTMTKINQATPRGRENIHYKKEFQGKIWRTENAGQSWTELTSGINEKAQFCRIIVHPNDNNIVFAASNYGLYKSSDKGTTWSQIGVDAFDNNTMMDMDYYFNAETKEFVLYVIDQVRYFADGTTTRNTGGIFKSEDNGDTWVKSNGNLYLDLNELTGGVSWNYYQYIQKWFQFSTTQDAQKAYPQLPTKALQFFNSINVDPSDPNTLYVGFYDAQTQYSILPGRLWKTENRGETWINVARDFQTAWENDKDFWTKRNNPFDDNMEEGHLITSQQFKDNYPLRSMRYCSVNKRGDVMLLFSHNTFLSTDKGATWKQVDEDYTVEGYLVGRGNSNHPGSVIHQDKRLGEGIMYLGSGEHQLWKTTDKRLDDKIAVEFLEESAETVFAVTTHPLDENIVFTTSMRQKHMENIMRSEDAGKTWEVWGNATDGEWYMRTNQLTIDPRQPEFMYFGVNINKEVDLQKQGGFFASTDGGKQFNRRNNGLPTWPKVVDIEFDPRDNSYASLFVACQYNKEKGKEKGGLFFSNNRGESWTQITIPSQIEGVNSITFDHTQRIYITGGREDGAFDNGGAWYSDDFGTTWTQIFTGEYGFQFDVSPFDHNCLVLINGDKSLNPGVYLSEDRGLHWTKNNLTIGQPDKITDIAFDVQIPDRIIMTVLGSGFLEGKYADGKASRKITVEKQTLKLKLDTNHQMNVATDGLDQNTLLYKSANDEIATVSTAGEIEAKSIGLVKVWVTSNDGQYSDYVLLTVTEDDASEGEEEEENEGEEGGNEEEEENPEEEVPTSIDPTSKTNYQVYPQPIDRVMKIKSLTQPTTIYIYTTTGNLILNKNILPEENINLNALHTGVYICKFSQNNTIYTIKLLKK
ncbi:VPS10 domain-containing protein [Flammeovirga aprica]|uniref:T9SS type A sorting domain-containing protein n=1 Tax=Flammeovirga aprica JL-4 TaxID=694437 RepID=A0A7X9P1F9_9BACT|nr:T9SS type A sorting domain-containing protein [Flammeovirga aprica]NME67796.1 T9SS type A sorting domain-containing protein [Flammeovirga aprica JL-4]